MSSRKVDFFDILLQTCSSESDTSTFFINLKFKHHAQRELTSEVAGIILRHVRNPKGKLTEISELCRINRKEFNVRGLSKMKLHRLLRIIYALALTMSYDQYRKMTDEVRDVIWEHEECYDYLLFDE